MSSEHDRTGRFIREVAIRYRGARFKASAKINHPADAVRVASKIVKDDAREHFLALYLDSRHRPIAYSIVSIGTANLALVHPREVFQPAVLAGAVAVILLHNHPSGDPIPSLQDLEVTERLTKAGELLGITLLDHIVWTREGSHHSITQASTVEAGP